MGELLPLPRSHQSVLVGVDGREKWASAARSYYSATDMRDYAKANLAAALPSPEVSEAEVERAMARLENCSPEDAWYKEGQFEEDIRTVRAALTAARGGAR